MWTQRPHRAHNLVCHAEPGDRAIHLDFECAIDCCHGRSRVSFPFTGWYVGGTIRFRDRGDGTDAHSPDGGATRISLGQRRCRHDPVGLLACANFRSTFSYSTLPPLTGAQQRNLLRSYCNCQVWLHIQKRKCLIAAAKRSIRARNRDSGTIVVKLAF